jgi:hypothetical protein
MIDFFNVDHWVSYTLGMAASQQLGEKETLFLKESLNDAILAKVCVEMNNSILEEKITIL